MNKPYWMSETTYQRIQDTGKVMNRVHSDGLAQHRCLIDEALAYFLLDVLTDEDFERVKLDFKKDFK